MARDYLLTNQEIEADRSTPRDQCLAGGKVGLALAFFIAHIAFAQLQPAQTIIMIGPPGSGKTVQSEFLHKRYKIPAISMVQLIHQEITKKSPLGKALQATLTSEELLGDGFANDLMAARLLRPDVANGFILDGYPATEGQARALDQWLAENKMPKPTILVLDVPEEVSRNRLVKRRRPGDAPPNIERRLRDYVEVGRLVERWYGPERMLKVDGTGTPADVATRIVTAMDRAQSSPAFKQRPTTEEPGFKQREAKGPAPQQKP